MRDTRCKYSEKFAEAFIAAISEGIPISRAAEDIGVPRCTLYNWRRSRPEFKERWEQAWDCGAAALEEEAIRRACEGILEPVFYQGKKIDEVRKYSDRLLEKLLEARNPDRFGRKQLHEHTGRDGGAIMTTTIDPKGLTREQLRAISAIPINGSGRPSGEA